MRSAA